MTQKLSKFIRRICFALIVVLTSSIYLDSNPVLSDTFKTTVKPIDANRDEQEIMRDRDNAINAAFGEIKKETPAPSAKAEKKDKDNEIKKHDQSSPAPAEKETRPKKRRSWFAFWGKNDSDRAAPNIMQEVREKRKERLEQFPGIDPEHVRESIDEMKIVTKREFLAKDKHSLEDVISRAVQVHLPAQIARERIELAEKRIIKAFRDFFSDLDFTRTQKDGTLSTDAYKSRSWRLAFRQPLFRGGIIWNTFQLEMEGRETARREYEKTVSNLVADVSKAYFEYERAWNVLEDRKRLFGKAQEAKRVSDEKNQAKLISEIEKLNVDSLFSQAQYDLETAQQDLELAKLDLQKYLALEIADPVSIESVYQIDNIKLVDLSGKPIPLSFADEPEGQAIPRPELQESRNALEQYVDMAYAHRSDLRVEASKLHAARLSRKISGGKMLPEWDLVVEFGELAEAFQTIAHLPPYRDEWKIGSELSWNVGGSTFRHTYDHDQRAPSVSQFLGTQGPISDTHTFSFGFFDNLNSLAELKETKIAALEQVVELEKTEREVIREVKEAYFNYNKALIQVESNYKRMNYRDRLAQLAQHRLETNEIQVSEFLQSEIDYTEERMQVHKALSDFYTSKANLNRAIGVRDYLQIESHQFESR